MKGLFIMARLQIGIALCLLSLLGFTSTAFTKDDILGTVRLRDDRLIFQAPSTPAKTKGYVTVSCPAGKGDAVPTTYAVEPLATARAGETLTIVEIAPCKYSNGDYFAGHFVKVKTYSRITGYTQLPNYHDAVEPANHEGGLLRLLLHTTSCRNSVDPECFIKIAVPFRQFVDSSPHSRYTAIAAHLAATSYLNAAQAFLLRAGSDPNPNAQSIESLSKANHYFELSQELDKFANAPLPADSTPSSEDEIVKGIAVLLVFIVLVYCLMKFGERQRLENIKGFESWSPDDTAFRLHEIRRFQRQRLNPFRKSQKLEDAVFKLERRSNQDTPPDTIIGIVLPR